MIGTITVILVLGFLIFFHELGHFLVARSLGIGVRTFSLGFGPVLASKAVGKTTYQVAALPLGGFVAIVGESSDAEIPEGFSEEESFSLRPAWQRLLVVMAGSVFNLLLAWFICWGLVWSNGLTEVPPVVGQIIENSAAAESPLREGDRILSINGNPVSRWEELPQFMRTNKDASASFVVQQEGEETRTIAITPRLNKHEIEGKIVESWGIGILPRDVIHTELGFFASAGAGAGKAVDMATLIWRNLGDLLAGRESPKNLGGPVLIAQVIYEQSSEGLINVLVVAAIISVNLGILNLLPIPVLDGGHILFLLIETLFKRPVPVNIQEKAVVGGLCLLLSLMVFATFNDIMRLVGGGAG